MGPRGALASARRRADRPCVDSAPEEMTMRYRLDPVKYGGDEDDNQGGNPNGGCGDGQGCGRQ
ncbi:hypothetical protein TPA0598_01_01660 [Streptomyces lydicamycinicus]|uniref:Uncharacterized protein n=1 Tax=Streptomyces lydicamycinicus TaxID=1546107 RepID=A0A0P4QZT7_9ACTN|nr:hypothetical protein TPA0598_01_01660 [Streptomyces lydicamycinicus]